MRPVVQPVITGATQILAHTPGLARHGSKPGRELPRDAGLTTQFMSSLRSFDEAAAYLPNRAYLGALHPRDLPARPWYTSRIPGSRFMPYGEIMPEPEFIGLMAAVDEFGLAVLERDFAAECHASLGVHKLSAMWNLLRLSDAKAGRDPAAAEGPAAPAARAQTVALQLADGREVGYIRAGHETDAALTADVILENLACKATALLALSHLVAQTKTDPDSIDYVLSCAEEAIGDRYQRGGGNMAKAVAFAAGLSNASGCDVKNFCAAPIPALVTASALVAAGVFRKVAVVAGGSLPKLGMKFQGHLKNDMPVLEDVLGGSAFLVEPDDEVSPRVRLDVVGKHPVGAGASNPAIMQALAVQPLESAGLKMTDVDDFGTELHNPEVTEPQGSGNVPERNYKTIAALAARRGEISSDQVAGFVAEHGMPGYAPTQGHLASALCYLPHALSRLTTGDAGMVQLIAKGSLFLGRMSQLSDGMSVLLERNSRR